MYEYFTISDNYAGASTAVIKQVERYGISIHVDTDSDWCGPDFIIDPADTEGIKIFREFAARMAAHYKTLKIKS